MFLTVHSAIGIAVGEHISNPYLAFFTGILLHYLGDMIPHGDSKALDKYKNPIHIIFAGMVDAIFLFFMVFGIFIVKRELLNIQILLIILGSILPDLCQLVYFAFPKNIFWQTLQKYHNFFHNLISAKYEMSFTQGIAFQAIIAIIVILIIL